MRGAWIEISISQTEPAYKMSLPMRGAWIEIFMPEKRLEEHERRSPCGERGLKSFDLFPGAAPYIVAPHAGSVD